MENEIVSAEDIDAFLSGKIDLLAPDSAFPAISPGISRRIAIRSRAIDWFNVLHWGRVQININTNFAFETLSDFRYPGREQLDSRIIPKPKPHIQWEIDDIVAFLPDITPAGIVKWVVLKVYGPEVMTDKERKAVLTVIARSIRDKFERRTVDAATLAPLGVGQSTVGELTDDSSLATLVSQPSAAGAAVAKASQALDKTDRDLGKTFLLTYYAGLAADEVALLMDQTATKVEHDLKKADSFVRGQLASI